MTAFDGPAHIAARASSTPAAATPKIKDSLATFAFILMPVLACYPVWIWCASRMRDGSDDPYGFVALIAAICFLLANGTGQYKISNVDGKQAFLITFCLLCYGLTEQFLPMLIRAGFATTAIALSISAVMFRQRINVPIWGLLLLSLPVVATLQFYLGFPLRMVVTKLATIMLSFAGYYVQQTGTDILCGTQIVGIDPACSGVKMLWTGFFTVFSLACLYKLNNKRTIILCFAGLGIIVGANVIRATSLFLLESFKLRMGAFPDWVHSGVGVIVFTFTVLAIALVTTWFARMQGAREERPKLLRQISDYKPTPALSILAAATIAFAAPLLIPHINTADAAASLSYKVPDLIEGREVHEIPLSAMEKRFAESFPGRIHKLSDNWQQIVFRVVAQPTRQLHPAEDCFKGMGYRTHSQPNYHDSTTSWGVFEAEKDGVKLSVRERIYDASGNSWTDVSSWYWAATLGQTHGPWQALTIATPR